MAYNPICIRSPNFVKLKNNRYFVFSNYTTICVKKLFVFLFLESQFNVSLTLWSWQESDSKCKVAKCGLNVYKQCCYNFYI